MIRLARVYDDLTPDDGTQVLVDRLWPRGMRRDDPRVGRWDKDVAPSTELRRWYGHQPLTLTTATTTIDGSELPVLKDVLEGQ